MRSSLLILLAAAAIPAGALHAQTTPARALEWHGLSLRPYVGASIPTGGQRDVLDAGVLLGAEAAYGVARNLRVIGDGSWTRPSTKLVSVDARTNVFQYDAGLEWSVPRAAEAAWRPFVALGGGVRDYRYAASALDDHAGGVGFGAVGTDFLVRQAALRIEARDNVFSYASPLAGGGRSTRNDLGLALGVSFHLHGA